MKREVILFISLTICFTAFSQKTHRVMGWKISKDIPQNEVKLNLASTIFILYPEISYERILSEDFSLGATIGINLDEAVDFRFDEDNYFLSFGFIPYVRWFFGGNSQKSQKYAKGFFIEANGALMALKREDSDVSYNGESVWGAGLGMALGWKLLSRNNWVGELYIGAGHDFSNYKAYTRLGIAIGKRF